MRTQSDRGWVLEALCRAPPVLLPVTYARRAEAVCEAVHIGCVGARLIVRVWRDDELSTGSAARTYISER
jgi:hypothetical protein